MINGFLTSRRLIFWIFIMFLKIEVNRDEIRTILLIMSIKHRNPNVNKKWEFQFWIHDLGTQNIVNNKSQCKKWHDNDVLNNANLQHVFFVGPLYYEYAIMVENLQVDVLFGNYFAFMRKILFIFYRKDYTIEYFSSWHVYPDILSYLIRYTIMITKILHVKT